jgi:molybdenum cofactor cytidylyltransferase
VKPIAGILLGAGSSARFGSEKLLACLPTGERLIERALRVHLQSQISPLIVVTSPNLRETIAENRDLFSYSKMMLRKRPAHWSTFCCRWGNGRLAANEKCKEGMSSSIKAGLRCLTNEERAPGVLISLADLPLLSPKTINYLIGEFQKETVGMLLPVFNEIFGHPVIVDINRFKNEINQIRGDIGLRVLIEKHPKTVRKITWSDDSVIRDIDTKMDLKKLRGV